MNNNHTLPRLEEWYLKLPSITVVSVSSLNLSHLPICLTFLAFAPNMYITFAFLSRLRLSLLLCVCTTFISISALHFVALHLSHLASAPGVSHLAFAPGVSHLCICLVVACICLTNITIKSFIRLTFACVLSLPLGRLDLYSLFFWTIFPPYLIPIGKFAQSCTSGGHNRRSLSQKLSQCPSGTEASCRQRICRRRRAEAGRVEKAVTGGAGTLK